MNEQATAAPTRKVVAGGIAGSISIILVWALNATLFKGNPMPAEVAAALTTVLSSVAAYFTRPHDRDIPVTN